MAMESGEVLALLSEQAFRAAEALRDPHNGPEKEEMLRLSCINLRSLLNTWGKIENRPPAGSLDRTVFDIFHDAKNCTDLRGTNRPRMVRFARNALKLRNSPGSWDRETAVKFFQRIGELTRAKGEERTPARETAAF